jgi:hypothetical protein
METTMFATLVGTNAVVLEKRRNEKALDTFIVYFLSYCDSFLDELRIYRIVDGLEKLKSRHNQNPRQQLFVTRCQFATRRLI